MKKLLLVASLVALTVLSASAFAQDVPASEKSVQANEAGKRVKRETQYGPENRHVTGRLHKETVDIPEGYGHGKFHVRNDGNASVTLTFERTSDSKDTNLQGHVSNNSTGVVRIPAGESKTIYTQSPTGTGEHRIQMNSSNASLDAKVTYKYSNSRDELD